VCKVAQQLRNSEFRMRGVENALELDGETTVALHARIHRRRQRIVVVLIEQHVGMTRQSTVDPHVTLFVQMNPRQRNSVIDCLKHQTCKRVNQIDLIRFAALLNKIKA
jgi:hypothetical protein